MNIFITRVRNLLNKIFSQGDENGKQKKPGNLTGSFEMFHF